jgi:hypothetical protein
MTSLTQAQPERATVAEVMRAAAVVAGARRGVVETAPGGAAGSGDGLGSDFESQMVKGFAEMGGALNFYTPHVDSCGTVCSGPIG